MRRRPLPSGQSDSEPQFEVGRESEEVDEPTSKRAEDPALLSVGQEAADPRFEVDQSAPEVDEDSSKVAEDPSASIW